MRKQSHPVSKRENYETYETVLYQRDDFHCPHNPEVAGSSPAAATIKTAGFDKKSAVFLTFRLH